VDPAARAESIDGLARAAVGWLIGALPGLEDDPSLYHGRAGALWALHEADAVDGALGAAARVADALADEVDTLEDCSLYFGLTGVAVALSRAGRHGAAERALDRVRARLAEPRVGGMNELLLGNAGIALGAVQLGDLDLACASVAPYVTSADRTTGGVNWAVRAAPARSHHVAHGTLGIVLALATVGRATKRADLVELAVAGAADVVSRNEAGPEGFLVPHSDPPHRPDLVERYSYGWCNGPAGDAQVFRLLHQGTGDPAYVRLQDACWRTIRDSGLPERRRPGFWDNNGRCCGTAGVLALALDRVVERGDDLDVATTLVDDLLARATVDRTGARWSNHEHRADPSDLEPRAGWAMGNAGIVPELLRYARLARGQDGDYAAPWPDRVRPRGWADRGSRA
jgi:hypothetical protein